MVYKVPEFPAENVPVPIAASILGKDQTFVREAMRRGILDLGICFKKEGSEQYDVYIGPFKLWQLTGYVYQGYETELELMNIRKETRRNRR